MAVGLALLAAAAAARARAAWTGASSSATAAAPSLGPAPRGAASPLVPPDPRATLVDLWLPDALAPRPLRLPAGARLADLLAAAGLSEHLPVEGSGDPRGPLPPGRRLEVALDGRARLAVMPAVRRVRLGLPLDLNADDADALALLPGIGPARAAAIVADRARRGPFGSVRALARVRGIGPTTAARLAGRLTAGSAGTR